MTLQQAAGRCSPVPAALAVWAALCVLTPGVAAHAEPPASEGPAPATSIAVTLEQAGGSLVAAPLPPTVVATWYGKGPAAVIEAAAEVGKALTLPLGPGRWLLHAKAPGFWGEPVQLELAGGEEARSLRLKLWPAATLEGGVILPAGEEAPPDFAAFFRPSPEVPKGKEVPPGSAVCPIREKKWACTVPAGLLDIRFQASGFIPRYLWSVNAKPGKPLRVGSPVLARGSAVQGWVVTADGTPLAKDAKITLRPRGAGGVPNLTDVTRAKSLATTAAINARGFFEIEAVPPGEYTLEATSGRLAPAVTTVQVVPGRVTEVANPPLVLEHPITLKAYLDPPMDPWGEPWRIELFQVDLGTMILSKKPALPAGGDGAWVSDVLTPGRYGVSVLPSRGGTWWSAEIEVDARTAPLQIELDVVSVRGTIRLGKRPLAATLSFGGRHRPLRIETASNADGDFALVLPKRGDWRVSVSAAEPLVERELARVEVSPKPGTDEAEVDIRLPNTVVRGKVVDEAGEIVAGAVVAVRPAAEERIHARTDAHGEFELRGIPPGPALVTAESGASLEADIQTVEVVNDLEPPSLILVLRESLKVAGLVGSAVGAVPGVQIKAAPLGIPYIGVPAVSSDSQGRFQLTLPRATQEMLLAVGGPGFAFRMLRAPVPAEGPLTLGLRQESGTLIVETEEPIDWAVAGSVPFFVLHGGGIEGLAYLATWAYRNGVAQRDPYRVSIPHVEPGEYVVCRAVSEDLAALEMGLLPARGCAKGNLVENGELRLTVGERARP